MNSEPCLLGALQYVSTINTQNKQRKKDFHLIEKLSKTSPLYFSFIVLNPLVVIWLKTTKIGGHLQ